jgi:hypothetical protein
MFHWILSISPFEGQSKTADKFSCEPFPHGRAARMRYQTKIHYLIRCHQRQHELLGFMYPYYPICVVMACYGQQMEDQTKRLILRLASSSHCARPFRTPRRTLLRWKPGTLPIWCQYPMAIRGYTSYIVMDRNGVYSICMYTYIYRKRERERGTVYVNIKLHILQQHFFTTTNWS